MRTKYDVDDIVYAISDGEAKEFRVMGIQLYNDETVYYLRTNKGFKPAFITEDKIFPTRKSLVVDFVLSNYPELAKVVSNHYSN